MVHKSVLRPCRRSADAYERMRRGVRLLFGVGVAVASLTISPFATAGALEPGSPVSDASAFGNLTGISCVSPRVCMVTGDIDDVSGGSVIGTTDGGRTWQQLTAPPGVGALAAVSCATSVICEVAGSGNGDAGAVYGTTDGGKSWTIQSAVIGGGFFLAIACPSIEVCEATGNEGMIFGTVNGGASWSQQKVPPSADLVNGISCPSITTCEAVGYGVGAIRTSDGGTDWLPQALPSSVQELSGVSCYSLTHCVAVGIDSTHSGRREIGVLVSTDDGGVTWIRRNIPTGIDDLTSVACRPSGMCEAVGLGSTAIIGSTDGGRMWTPQVVPGSPYLLSVACPGLRKCEAVGQKANDDVAVYRTTDGGAQWYRQHLQ
jgi:photosystem II stability/assembly factor-like uncharacterized protein